MARRFLGYKSTRSMLKAYGVIVVMAAISFLIRSARYPAFSDAQQVQLSLYSLIGMSIFWEVLRLIDRFLDSKLPFESGLGYRIAVQLGLGILFGLFIRYLIAVFGEPYLTLKLDQMFVAATWFIYAFLPTAVNLGFFSIHFVERWKESLVKAEKLEREKSQVQFDNLKNQLNPHFLFNALTSLNSLIHEDQQLASQFLQQLSKVYRYVLQNKDKTVVPLSVELEFIGNYVSLLHTRFGSALRISFDVDKDAANFAIVPVTLQILIENAIKHNILDPDQPLTIEVRTDNNGYLDVVNNVQPRKDLRDSNQQGLENLRNLYRFLTDKPIYIESGQNFLVKIPLL